MELMLNFVVEVLLSSLSNADVIFFNKGRAAFHAAVTVYILSL